MMPKTNIFSRPAIAAAVLAGLSTPALAHHGFGLFQMEEEGTWSGTLTKMNLVNPHSYMELDSVGENGEIVHMRCEMRAASLLRRAGWDTDMFVVGAHVEIYGRPHRDDPTACYIETFTLDDSVEVNRNDQFVTDAPVDFSNRPLRLADGQINLSGDWAVEQLVLTIGPEGGNGSMVPRSLTEAFASGELTIEEIRAMQPPRPQAVYTEEGEAAAQAFDRRSPEDNPWFACKPTSIIRDWTADWPINRFVQRITAEGEAVIDITYGLYNFERRIHVGMEAHPADLEPSYSGHSIGRWEGDTLVVDTIGFAAGVLSPPTRNSEQLHIVERFTLDPETMSLTREYTATDPVYLAEPYESYDVMYLSDVPFQPAECVDMTPEFQPE
ncbi:MAG: hypothetical protein JXB36_20450 [Gammaproteobacteria bacterium]|nr:hypothetical protein [Gammaproteobacteria bacterium]